MKRNGRNRRRRRRTNKPPLSSSLPERKQGVEMNQQRESPKPTVTPTKSTNPTLLPLESPSPHLRGASSPPNSQPNNHSVNVSSHSSGGEETTSSSSTSTTHSPRHPTAQKKKMPNSPPKPKTLTKTESSKDSPKSTAMLSGGQKNQIQQPKKPQKRSNHHPTTAAHHATLTQSQHNNNNHSNKKSKANNNNNSHDIMTSESTMDVRPWFESLPSEEDRAASTTVSDPAFIGMLLSMMRMCSNDATTAQGERSKKHSCACLCVSHFFVRGGAVRFSRDLLEGVPIIVAYLFYTYNLQCMIGTGLSWTLC